MNKIIIGAGGGGDALAIIDPQKDFVHPTGALYVAGVEGESSVGQVIERINSLIRRPFDYFALTRDSHPNDHIEFFKFGKHCLMGRGGEGAKIITELDAPKGKAVERIYKGQDVAVISYSIVTSPSFGFHMGQLRANNIKRVFVVGWAYTHCAGESAMAYAAQGFETYIVRDATRSVSRKFGGDPELMDRKLQLCGVKSILFSDID